MYSSLRARHGGFGTLSASVQPRTIAATRSPNRSRMTASVGNRALILDGIVEERGDCLILIAAIFEHERGHAEQMRDIGQIRPLAPLPSVQVSRVRMKRLGKSSAKVRASGRRGHPVTSPSVVAYRPSHGRLDDAS